MNKIDEFKGKYFFLSNFYNAPIEFNGGKYLNSEAAFQAQKCEDPNERIQFYNLNPSDAKRKGRHVLLRPDWEDIKYNVMKDIIKEKFSQNKDLAIKLLDTGNAILIEGNTWGDTTWGQCRGRGQNLLGKILMECRKDLEKKNLN